MKRVGRGAVPVVLARSEEDAVARADHLDRPAAPLAEPDALGHVDRLAERVGVPRGAGARGEVDEVGLRAGRRDRRRHRVDVDVAGEPGRRALGGVDAAPRDLHGGPPSRMAGQARNRRLGGRQPLGEPGAGDVRGIARAPPARSRGRAGRRPSRRGRAAGSGRAGAGTPGRGRPPRPCPRTPSSAFSSASEESMSRLSVGSSSSSRLWPSSSRQRISSRAFWPPRERVGRAVARRPAGRSGRARASPARARPAAPTTTSSTSRCGEVGARVELGEQARRDAVADPQLAVVRDLLAGEQPHQVRLAGAVGADQADRARRSGSPPRTGARARRSRASRSATTIRAESPPRIRTLICWSTTGRGRRAGVDEAAASASRPRRPSWRTRREIAARCFMIL